MQNLETVYFVISLKPRRQGGRAWYEVADNKAQLPKGARVIGGTQTAHLGRAIQFKKECIKGYFWNNRKRRARDRFHADKAQRDEMRERYRNPKPVKADNFWSKYDEMVAV